MPSHISVGIGEDISIADLGNMLAAVTGFTGRLTFDTA